jgi:DnaA family protein
MRQLILDLLPEAPPSFDNFVAGSNAEALTGLAAWLAPATASRCSSSGAKRAPASRTCCRPARRRTRCAARPGSVGNVLPRRRQSSTPSTTSKRSAKRADRPLQPDQSPARQRRAPARRGRRAAACASPARGPAHPAGERPGLPPAAAERRRETGGARRTGERAAWCCRRRLQLPFCARTARHAQPGACCVAIDRYSLEHKRPITLPLLREVLQTSVTG